jgi:hypothetical protein
MCPLVVCPRVSPLGPHGIRRAGRRLEEAQGTNIGFP